MRVVKESNLLYETAAAQKRLNLPDDVQGFKGMFPGSPSFLLRFGDLIPTLPTFSIF